MYRVLVADPIAQAGIERLRTAAEVDVRTGLTADALAECIGEYDALAVRSETKVTAEILARASRLKIVGRAGVGVDNIDVRAATERGILVVNSPQGNTIAAAELTIAMLLALARRIPQADASLRAGRWDRKNLVGAEVYGKTLGIIGLGKIGMEVARRARVFEMNVIAFDPYANEELAQQHGVRLVTLDDVFTGSDYISLHVPLNEETRGLIGEAQLQRMRDGVRIVNCARGGLVDEAALADAIRAGKVAGAALDTFAKEPVPPDNPLLALPENVLTPHLGASTEEAQVNVAVDIAEQIIDVLHGRPARSAVNMPALSAESMAVAQPYLLLGEKIGSLHAQLARDLEGRGHPVETVEIHFQGDFSEIPTGAVTRSVLAGLLSPILSDPVNLVNAPLLATERGIRVTEAVSNVLSEYSQMLTVKVTTSAGPRTICGTVFGSSDIRIVHVDGYRVDIPPEGIMLMTVHQDRPGMIGAVGTLLGSAGVNIAGLHLGREKVGGRALMVLLVDDPISDELLACLRVLPGMETARRVVL